MRGPLAFKVVIDAIVKCLLRVRQLIPAIEIGGGELIKHRRRTAGWVILIVFAIPSCEPSNTGLGGYVPGGWFLLTSHPCTEVVVLDGSRDGLQQIADYLDGRTGIDAILSHGDRRRLATGGNARKY